MRILLFGKHGQLGWELRRSLMPLGEVAAWDYPEIDLKNGACLRQLIQTIHPDVIVNATAYTAVDRAETEQEIAMAINADAVAIMAQEACSIHAALIHYSTDYVFDGAKGSAYDETDAPNPSGVYGKSKLAGEEAITQTDAAYLILRTSWVYSLRRDSFVKKVLQWSRQQRTLRVVSDQVSNPTWARALAETSALLLARGGTTILSWLQERRGLYHLAGSGFASRMEWAQAILRLDPQPQEQVTTELLPALTADFPTPAQRPLYSALNCQRFQETFDLALPPWEQTLALAMETEA
jgi:dTDP-4-dehydrorhamnose reductase